MRQMSSQHQRFFWPLPVAASTYLLRKLLANPLNSIYGASVQKVLCPSSTLWVSIYSEPYLRAVILLSNSIFAIGNGGPAVEVALDGKSCAAKVEKKFSALNESLHPGCPAPSPLVLVSDTCCMVYMIYWHGSKHWNKQPRTVISQTLWTKNLMCNFSLSEMQQRFWSFACPAMVSPGSPDLLWPCRHCVRSANRKGEWILAYLPDAP